MNTVKSEALSKVKKLQKELESNIVERKNEIEGSLAALIAKVHVLFLGPPGTAKSLLAENLCNAIDNGKFFRWLLTKYTTPEELFGPPSLKGLENDEYRRITKNKLPEATIAFLDEIFKANSAILNSLLTLVNERKFDNNGSKPMEVPLVSCFGASNELPQGEELGALYDRFLMRYWVKEIQDDNNFQELLTGTIGNNECTVQLTIAELDELYNMLNNIELPTEILFNLRKLQYDLKSKGITASDRRWKSAVSVLKAISLIRGSNEINGDILESLADMLWNKPEDRRVILEEVSKYGNPLNLLAIEYEDMAKEVFDNWTSADANSKADAAMQAYKEISAMLKKIDQDLYGRSESETKKLKETYDVIQNYKRVLTTKMMED